MKWAPFLLARAILVLSVVAHASLTVAASDVLRETILVGFALLSLVLTPTAGREHDAFH